MENRSYNSSDDEQELDMHSTTENSVDTASLPKRQPVLQESIGAPSRSGNGLLAGGALVLVAAAGVGFFVNKLRKRGKDEKKPLKRRSLSTQRSPSGKSRPASVSSTASTPSASPEKSSRPATIASPAAKAPSKAGPKLPARSPKRPTPSMSKAPAPPSPAKPDTPAADPVTSPKAAAAAAAAASSKLNADAKPFPPPAASAPPADPASASSAPLAEPSPAASAPSEPPLDAPRKAAAVPPPPPPQADPPAPPLKETPAPEKAEETVAQQVEVAPPPPPAAAVPTPPPAAASASEALPATPQEGGSKSAAAPASEAQEGAEGGEEGSHSAAAQQAQQQQGGEGEPSKGQQAQQAEAAVVKGKAAKPEKSAEPEKVESIRDYAVPELSFEGGPAADSELTEVEQKARQMSIHAHKLLQNRNLSQAVKEQRAAVDLLLAPESVGKARPALLVNCALSLSDLHMAQRSLEDSKKTLALAFAAAQHLQDPKQKGGGVHSLMNYAFVLKGEGKAQSAQAAFEEAHSLARGAYGPAHPTVEKVKYELIAQLVNTDQQDRALSMLLESADELLKEAERLEKEEGEEGEEEQPEKAKEEAQGAGEAGGEGEEGEEEEKPVPPPKMARNFAMRNLMNAAGLMDNQKNFDKGHELLERAHELALQNGGENSVAEMNVLSAMAQHCRRRERIEDAIELNERVLGIMDETIQVYDPDTLKERVAILRDTAVLLKQVERYEDAIDFATGALVNCQTLLSVLNNGRPIAGHPMLEPFYLMLAELKEKAGDAEGAAEARRSALQGRLQGQVLRGRGGRGGGRGLGAGRGGKRAASTGASTTRAGGRRK